MEYLLSGDVEDSLSALLELAWSKEDDKIFESYLNITPEEDPNRFEVISCSLPGRTADQLKKRYHELVTDVNAIEAGQVPFPEYNDRDIWESIEEDQRRKLSKNSAEKPPKQRRNPGFNWTVEEHRCFLEGLEKLGNGDWRGISRQYVKTKTPTQVASHAQKYRLRKSGQGAGKTNRKRGSIHDITLDDEDRSRTLAPEQAMLPENMQNGTCNLQQQEVSSEEIVRRVDAMGIK